MLTLLAIWLGFWMPWIAAEAVSLRLNPLDMAEWATFLPAARNGPLTWFPDLLRMSCSLAAIAFCLGAGFLQKSWARWLLRGLALLPGLLILPPYPEVLQLWGSPSYGARFVIAALTLGGVPVATTLDRFDDRVRSGVCLLLSGGAVALGVWSFVVLSASFTTGYARLLSPGAGAILAWAGQIGLGLAALFRFLSHDAQQNNNGPVA